MFGAAEITFDACSGLPQGIVSRDARFLLAPR
jgi:hypothetical protein